MRLMRAFLFAHPAAHSLSPYMHCAAFQYANWSGDYQAQDVLPEHLPAAIVSLKQSDILGCNLSLPHKEQVIPLLDGLSPSALTIGAVNTVIHRDGLLYGDNTDAPGLMASLYEGGYQPQGVALILGAGGAARAAVYALQEAGVDVWMYNRTLSTAQQLMQELCPHGRVFANQSEIPWSQVGLLLNASSVGLNQPQHSPLNIPFPQLATGAYVCDMVYKPLNTRLLQDAQAAGFHSISGLGMLVHQARLAFKAWTQKDVPAEVFYQAAYLQLNTTS